MHCSILLKKNSPSKIDILSISNSPVCECRFWWHFLVYVIVLKFHGWIEVQTMDRCGTHGVRCKKIKTKSNRWKTSQFHTARVVSSKHQKDSAVQCDLKQWCYRHVFSQNTHCSLWDRRAFVWVHMRMRQSCLCLHSRGSCAYATSEREKVILNTAAHKKKKMSEEFQHRGGVLYVSQSRWSQVCSVHAAPAGKPRCILFGKNMLTSPF